LSYLEGFNVVFCFNNTQSSISDNADIHVYTKSDAIYEQN